MPADDRSALTYCPTCQGPLTPLQAQARIVNNSCQVCTPLPPVTNPGDILYCSRTGKELSPADFEHHRAFCVSHRCFSVESLRAERQAARESGVYLCDSCKAKLTALDFLSGEAQVLNGVILCVACQAKEHRRAARRGKKLQESDGDSGRSPKAVSSRKPAATMLVGQNDAGNNDDTRPESRDDLDVPSEPGELEMHTSPINTGTNGQSGPQAVVPMAGPFVGAARLARRRPVAELHPNETLVRPAESRALIGVLVLMIVLLSVMVVALFLSTQSQSVAQTTELVNGLFKMFQERHDRLQQQAARAELRTEALERRLDALVAASAAAATNTPPRPAPSNANPAPAQAEDPRTDPRIKALQSAEAGARLEAVMDIHARHVRKAIPFLIERVRDDTDDFVRASAIRALVGFRATEARDVLDLIVRREQPGIVRDAASEALQWLGRR